MQAVADNVGNKITYKGIVYEGERPEFRQELPNAGVDVQHENVYWVLEDGRCENWTVAELAEKKLDELVDPMAREAYYAIGNELGYLPLGMLPEETLEAYREMPGTLEERTLLSLCFLNIVSKSARAHVK